MGDQTFVPLADAQKEMKDNGYDSSVLPSGGLTRGYLNALQDQQKAIQTDAHNADQAGLRHTSGIVPSWRGIDEFVGGNVADSPLFVLGGGAMGAGLKAVGVEALGELGIAAGVGVRAGESAGVMSTYDIAKKEAGTAPGDKDIGIYDIAHDAMFAGVVGGITGLRSGRAPADIPVLKEHQTFLQQTFPGIQITSGLRSAEHNAAIGGALNSMHLSGEATDFVLPKGVTADQAEAAIKAKGLPVTEWLIEKKGDPHSTGDHVHWGWGEKGEHVEPTPAVEGEPAAQGEPAAPGAPVEPSPAAPERAGWGAYSHLQEPLDAAFPGQMPGDPADNLKQATADALMDHVPDQTQPNGVRPVWQTPEAEQQMTRAAALPEMTPEAEKITAAATQAVTDAKATHAILNPEGGTEAFDAHMAAAQEVVQPVADFHNAVKAALECASIKGFD